MPAGFAHRIEAAWTTRGLLATLLHPLSLLYGAALALRRLAAWAGWPRVQRLPVPVIVVGNLIAGGAGKTPTVRAVVDLLRDAGWSPGVVSRGYGRRSSGVLEVRPDTSAQACGDEPLLIHLRSRVPVFVGRDRVGAARALLQAHPQVDVIVSDDGLQHRRLGRDAAVIVFDERGTGNGWLLPAGPLREPFTRVAPPRSVIVYNATAATTAWPGKPSRAGSAMSLRSSRGGPARRQARYRSTRCAGVASSPRPASRVGRASSACCANSASTSKNSLPDHFTFDTLPWAAHAGDVIVTEKDAVKLAADAQPATARVWVATLDFELAPASASRLLSLLPPRR